jgi:ribosomal protein L32
MNKKYRVIFLGLISPENVFKEKMSGFGVGSEQVAQIIEKAPVILKEDMHFGYARQYADAVQHAGGRVTIQENGIFNKEEIAHQSIEMLSLEKFVMCPECGHKQLRGKACVRCGLIYEGSKSI